MKKAHRHSTVKMMRRSSRVYLNELNAGKAETLRRFLHLCHTVVQYFVDLFWQRGDFSADLADLETVHRGCDRFGITTRLCQALAKQAKEMVRSAHAQGKRKPQCRKHTVTLYSHFVSISRFEGAFDWAVNLIGSGAPKMTIPVQATAHMNQFLRAHAVCACDSCDAAASHLNGEWMMAKTIRLGRDHKKRLFVDFIFEKPRPRLKTEGTVEGLDSNYKKGIVLSDGQNVAQEVYERIQTFGKRQRHTYAEVKSLIGQALKKIDLSHIKTLCVEDLVAVRNGLRGKFPRTLNRRLSHWLATFSVASQAKPALRRFGAITPISSTGWHGVARSRGFGWNGNTLPTLRRRAPVVIGATDEAELATGSCAAIAGFPAMLTTMRR